MRSNVRHAHSFRENQIQLPVSRKAVASPPPQSRPNGVEATPGRKALWFSHSLVKGQPHVAAVPPVVDPYHYPTFLDMEQRPKIVFREDCRTFTLEERVVTQWSNVGRVMKNPIHHLSRRCGDLPPQSTALPLGVQLPDHLQESEVGEGNGHTDDLCVSTHGRVLFVFVCIDFGSTVFSMAPTSC